MHQSLYQFQGDIRVNGTNYEKDPSTYLRNVGILLEPSYYDYMTAIENLKAYAYLSGIEFRDVEGEMRELLDIIGLGNAMRKKVREFSFGMKQKLGVAMAFIKKPDVLVLDEPSIGVDPKGLDAMFDMIKKFAVRDNIAIIFSSNNLKEVQDISNRISFLRDGKIIETVKTAEMLELDNSYTISVQNPISQDVKDALNKIKDCVIRETKIVINNYQNMNHAIRILLQNENPILDIERENRFLREFYE